MHSLPANLTEEEVAELEAAEKMPIIFDDDCPEMTEEMLSQFHRTDMVTIQISPVNMKKVKSFGADYSKILFDYAWFCDACLLQNISVFSSL